MLDLLQDRLVVLGGNATMRTRCDADDGEPGDNAAMGSASCIATRGAAVSRP